MKRICSHANKSHFLNKSFIFSLVLKVGNGLFPPAYGVSADSGPGLGSIFFLKNAVLGLGFG